MRIVVPIALIAIGAGCREDRRVQPLGSFDAGADVDASAPVGPPPADGGGTASPLCDLTGVWIVTQVNFSEALGAEQKAVNWFFHEIVQDGDSFEIVRSLNCGIRVTGTTTVTLPDATTEALSRMTSFSNGRRGTFRLTGDSCRLELERTYNLRGANLPQFLTDYWNVGDPPVDLADMPELPANAGEGMEDWDGDGMEGITLESGLGSRYVAQRDWNEYSGTVPTESDTFGGEGVIVVTWDGQEKVSEQTSPILRTTSTPLNPGHAWWARVNDELEIVETGEHPELETCKNVQRIALERFPDP